MHLVEQHVIDRNHPYFAEIDAAGFASKFLGRPALPKYKDKQAGRNVLTYTDQAISRKLLRVGIIFMHVASRRIVDHLVAAGIGTLVIGKNDFWKQQVNQGTRNNQNFVQIPHARFIEMLTYKCQLVGIQVITHNESHTSKCSFLDGELLCHQETDAGKRVKRGLFRSASGKLINADLNGALNILRKAIPAAFSQGIEGVVVHPVPFGCK